MTVNEQLKLLVTTNNVEILVHGLNLYIELGEGYYSVSPDEEKVLDKAKVTSLKVLSDGTISIQSTYNKEEV